MTDRELLELAAKAAGIPLAYAPHDHAYCGVLTAEWDKTRNTPYWSPLTDDGDALRLAVKLDMDMEQYAGDVVRIVYEIDRHAKTWDEDVTEKQDIYAATRRAIVCAAAKIGKEAS